MDNSSILGLTSQSIDRMLSRGGRSEAWVIDARRARGCRYLVCAWNSMGDYADATQRTEHGAAFFVAPIVSVAPAQNPDDAGRFDVRFTEFAQVNKPNVWTSKRNPIYHTSLDDLDISPDTLVFAAVRPASSGSLGLGKDAGEFGSAPRGSATGKLLSIAPLSIRAAKPRLAAFYEVPIEAVEIIIRG